jgi:hypothetical protein
MVEGLNMEEQCAQEQNPKPTSLLELNLVLLLDEL